MLNGAYFKISPLNAFLDLTEKVYLLVFKEDIREEETFTYE